MLHDNCFLLSVESIFGEGDLCLMRYSIDCHYDAFTISDWGNFPCNELKKRRNGIYGMRKYLYSFSTTRSNIIRGSLPPACKTGKYIRKGKSCR